VPGEITDGQEPYWNGLWRYDNPGMKTNNNSKGYRKNGKKLALASQGLALMVKAMVAVAAVFTVAITQAEAGDKPPKPGKGILHYFAQDHMENAGVVAEASGRVTIHENGKSKGKAQDIHIDAHHLEANATYDITSGAGQDTNGTSSGTVSVGEITTDRNGNAVVDLRDKGSGKAPAGKGKLPLPSELQPVHAIQQINIQDMNGAVVLSADLTTPDKFEYFVKTDMSGGSVKGSLDLKANVHKGQLKVSASGLEASSDYSLSLNGTPVTTKTTDGKGKLKIGWELDNPADALSLQTVDLLDSTGTAVASATLP